MATYDYLCLSCDHRFEEQRAMAEPVLTRTACPRCGGDRVRRQFSFFAGRPGPGASRSATAGCACGGACACGH